MRVVLLGAPGAGKGSIAALLKEKFQLLHISTGDILREQIKNNTALGQKAKGYIDRGALVPDAIVTELVESKLNGLDQGYLLDGFPRTRQQAEDLDKILARTNKPLDLALYLEATLPIIITRLTGRRVCKKCGALYHMTNKPPRNEGICDQCGGELYQRPDDKEETIRHRMDVYLTSTLPIIDYYKAKDRLSAINGDAETQALLELITPLFDEYQRSHRN